MKKIAEVMAVIVLSVVIGCHGGNGNSASVTTNNNDLVSGVVGTNSGSLITLSGNVSLSVPAGALANNINITVSRNNQSNLPGNMAVVYDFEPSGLSFNSAVGVSFKYDPALIPAGVNESDLVIAYQVTDNNWVEIPTTVDLVSHVLNGQTTHFSTYKIKPSARPYGEILGNFNGVDVRSNYYTSYNSNPPYTYNCCMVTSTGLSCSPTSGSCSGVVTGMEWECVEFIHRYYLQVYGIDLGWTGNANGYYSYYASAPHDSLVVYPNNGTSLPQPGDIIVSNGDGSPGNVGHVAIVKGLTPTTVTIVQQNWNENVNDVNTSFIPRNGNVLGCFGGGSQYPIKGWLRMPSVAVNLNGIALGILTKNLDGNIGIGPIKFSQTGTDFTVTIKEDPRYSGSVDTIGTGQMSGTKFNVKFTKDDLGNPINFEIKGNVLSSNILFGDYWLNSTTPTGKMEFYYPGVAESPALCSGITGTITVSDSANNSVVFTLKQSTNSNILELWSSDFNLHSGSGWLSGNQILLGFVGTYDAANPKVVILQGTISTNCLTALGTWSSHIFGSIVTLATGTWQMTR